MDDKWEVIPDIKDLWRVRNTQTSRIVVSRSKTREQAIQIKESLEQNRITREQWIAEGYYIGILPQVRTENTRVAPWSRLRQLWRAIITRLLRPVPMQDV